MKNKNTKTQQEIIINYLSSGKTITNPHALINWNILRLGSVVSALRKKGYPIKSRRKTNNDNTGSFSVYYFDKEYLEEIKKIIFI